MHDNEGEIRHLPCLGELENKFLNGTKETEAIMELTYTNQNIKRFVYCQYG